MVNTLIPILILLGLVIRPPGEYRVEVIHPGISTTKPVSRSLHRIPDGQGHPGKYHMDVESVVCGKSLCKVVPVRIHWDELGFYERYELLPGIWLEKDKGKPFEPADYEKLHLILKDPGSPLSTVDPDQMVKYTEDESAVDGISGATVLIDTSATVKGAVLTCYTLWHWAYGGIFSHIRRITGEGKSLSELREYLAEGDRNYRVFSLEQLNLRGAFDVESVHAVKSMAHVADIPLFKLSVGYLENAPGSVYFSTMESLLQELPGHRRIICLHSLLRSSQTAPDGYYDRLSRQLQKSETFQEVDLILKLVEQHEPSSGEAVLQAMNLLERNILIARRAYWYLSDRELTASQKRQIDTFRKKNEDYL